jgi:hypothetical protein
VLTPKRLQPLSHQHFPSHPMVNFTPLHPTSCIHTHRILLTHAIEKTTMHRTVDLPTLRSLPMALTPLVVALVLLHPNSSTKLKGLSPQKLPSANPV